MSKIKIGCWLLISFLICLMWGSASVAETKAPLSAEKAFVFSVQVMKENKVELRWLIKPGYYLYRDKFDFKFTPAANFKAAYPAPQFKHNKVDGGRAVYAGTLVIPVEMDTNAKSVHLTVNYQGCSEGGFCYPAVKKTVQLDLSAIHSEGQLQQQVSSVLSDLLTNQQTIVTLFNNQHIAILMLIFLGLGLLLAFTPCIFPMIPILTSIIVGHKQPVTMRRAFELSLLYVLGMALAYALMGLIAAAIGESIQIWLQNPWALSIGAALFVLLAISMFGFFDLRLPRYWHNYVAYWSYAQQGGSFVGVFLMGALSTIIVSPCVTAPLVGVLMYVAQTGNLLFGAMSLFMLGMGMGIPLLIVGLSAGKWLPKSGAWMDVVKKSFSFILLAMAIWLLSRFLSPNVANILWGMWIIGIGVFVGFYGSAITHKKIITYTAAFLVGMIGVIYMSDKSNLTRIAFTQHKLSPAAQHHFIVVNNMEQIKHYLADNKAHPVILDFYADWCESCVTMDENVFNQPVVQQALAGFTLLRFDLSKNTVEDQKILKHFNVIAPPTMLFFDEGGVEVGTRRIVGELSASELLSRIHIFYAEGCDKKASC